jgi:hypothetical protein
MGNLCKYFPNQSPEQWLMQNGLMDLIKSEHYRDNLIALLLPIEHAGAPPKADPAWSRIFRTTEHWFESVVLSGEFDKVYNADWCTKIYDAVLSICGRRRDVELERKISEVVVFWIIHYSLLTVLENK